MIGIFDSGIGGLSVLARIAQMLPQADIVYLADNAHIPYGNKSDDFIRARVLAAGAYLAGRGCTLIVVACNTATVAAVHTLRAAHPALRVVGVEPGVKPAAEKSRSGHIAVLATEATARSQRLRDLIGRYADTRQVRVSVVPCPGWATHVEMLNLDCPRFAGEIENTVRPVLADGADQVVLGCTHYSFLQPVLAPLCDGRAEIVDVAAAVARQTLRLAGETMPAPPAAEGQEHGMHGTLTLLSTLDNERLMHAFQRLQSIQPMPSYPAHCLVHGRADC